LRLLACIAILALCGCGRGYEELDAWTLDGTSVQLPAHLDAEVDRGAAYDLRSHVVLPESLRGGPLTLDTPWLPASVSLRVDGREVPPLDAPLADRFRAAGAHRWRIPDELVAKDAIDLDLHVENAWTQATWLDDPPRLSRTPAGDASFLAAYAFDEAVTLLGVPTIAILTLLYFALYLRDRSRPQNGWFALEGVGALWYPALMGGLLQPIFGRAEVAVAAPLLAFSAVATVHFTRAYLQLPRPSRAWWAALGVIVLVAIARGGPFEATRWVVPPTAGIVVAVAVHNVGSLLRVLRAGARPANLAIITLSWPIAVLVGCTDFCGWLGLGDPFGGVRAGSLGMSAVAVLQSIALTGEHVRSLREVEVLNVELRRQVAARSRQLADALARLGGGSREAPALAPGRQVDGRYTVVRELGQGGAGRVYEVERTSDRQRFALKVVTATTDAMMLARAAREAQLASEVRHPNVVTIVDVDVATEGFFFLVMELVDGRSLRDERPRFGHAEWALPILAQIAEGLAAIHARGIVHRDLKPANVLLAGGDAAAVVKIADFGIANLAPAKPPSIPPPPVPRSGDDDVPTVVDRADRVDGVHGVGRLAPVAAQPTGATITATGDLLGTPHYMAPEIVPIGVKAAQPPADVFAFGVMAYEMLAGRRPYGEVPAFLGLAISPPPPSFSAIAPSLSPRAAALLEACLARDPAQRPRAPELASVLRT
jgi:hypothetical protein